MKIVFSDVQPDGPGSVKMIPEESDDLWVAYNLIMAGDSVRATTVRKVIRQSASGNKDSERVKLTLEVDVLATEYDKEGCALRVQGKNLMENHYDVKIGAFHTLELDLHRPFVLRKDFWDELACKALREASDPSASADLAVLLMQEGTARIYLVGKSVTVCCGKGITVQIPRKYGALAAATYADAIASFFEDVLAYFLKCINFEVVKCVVIASPGMTKEQFHQYLLLEAERDQLRPILENKVRIVEARATSGYKHSLREVLDSPTVMNKIKDTKAAKEVQALKQFFSMMTNEPGRACYGPVHVDFAHEQLAVQTLLITDQLFRNPDVAARRKYSDLVKSVRDGGGNVHIFSTMHVSGEQLQQITGVAAILRYPLPELDDLEM